MWLHSIPIIISIVLCLVLAVILPRVELGGFYTFLREAPETSRTWFRLLFFPDLARRVSYADQLQVKVVLQTLHARHWIDGEENSVRVGRVDVPIGCLALLNVPGKDGRSVLDSSTFVIFNADTQPKIPVWLVQKSVRWQALIKEMLPTQDSGKDAGGVRFHVAVHTTLAQPTDLEQLKGLSAECERYIETVSAWIKDTLRTVLAGKHYMEVTRHPEMLLDELTTRWATAEAERFQGLVGLLTTTFTGIVPKLLHYQEDARFSHYMREVDNKNQQHEEIFRQRASTEQKLKQKYEKHVGELRTRFGQITGLQLRETDKGTELVTPRAEGKTQSAPSLSKLVHDRISDVIYIAGNNYQQSVPTVHEAFIGMQETLEDSTTKLIKSADDLADFVVKLKEEIRANSQPETGNGAGTKTEETSTGV